jgi:hypothetical protein
MSTFYAEKGICGWCGKVDAPFLCACKRISFFHKACLKVGWPEHRLSCPKAGDSSALSNGDIFHIHGLQNEQGKKMNGLAAEVISKDKTKGRFNVLFTAQEFIIKPAALKPENPKLALAVGEAASIPAAKRNGKSRLEEEKQKQIDYRKRSADLERTLSSLSGTEIMRRLNYGDIVMAQTLTLPGSVNVEVSKQLKLLQHGLIDACLRQFKYPLSIDEDCDPQQSMIPPILAINILENALAVGP